MTYCTPQRQERLLQDVVLFSMFSVACRFSSLCSLDLSGIPKLQDSQLQHLHRLQLTSISLAGCENVTSLGLWHVGHVTGLLALDLTGCCKVRPVLSDVLRLIYKHKAFALICCKWITLDFISTSMQGVKCVPH